MLLYCLIQQQWLTLGVLLCLTGTFETGLLSLLDPGIPGKQSVLAKHWFQAFISFDQSTGDAMSDRAALPGT